MLNLGNMNVFLCVCAHTFVSGTTVKRTRAILNSHCCKEEFIQRVHPNLGPNQDLDCQTSPSRYPIRYCGQGLLSQNEMEKKKLVFEKRHKPEGREIRSDIG